MNNLANHPNIGTTLDQFLQETNNLESATKIAKERVEAFKNKETDLSIDLSILESKFKCYLPYPSNKNEN